MHRAITNLLEYHIPVRPGREIVVLYDEDKAALAEVLGVGIAARGGVPRLEWVRDTAGLAERVGRLLDDERIGVVVLASHRMWAGLGALITVEAHGPVLHGRAQPRFLEVMPAASMIRVYGSEVAADRTYLVDLAARLPAHTALRLTAPGGTDLFFVAREWLPHDGEILTSPVEETVEGRIVADASVFFARVAIPIELTIVRGRIVAIRCADEADSVYRQYVRWMGDALRESPANGQLAEVGLGVNGGAALSGIIMEDETVRGTAHCCFGDNVRYGGVNASAWHGGTVVICAPLVQRA